MASPFAVTPASSSVRLDSQRRGELTFTVTNTSGRPMRGRAKAVAEDPKQQSWFRLEGEAERNFPGDKSTDQFVVKVNAPPNTPPGKALMRLDMFSVENPQEVFTKGPTVAWELAKAADEKKKPFPWWIIAVAAAVVVVIGVAVWFLMGGKKVPDVVNLPVDEAQKKIEAAGMRLGQKTDRRGGKAPGTVIAQMPAAGDPMPKNKTINLDVEAQARPDRPKPKPQEDTPPPSAEGYFRLQLKNGNRYLWAENCGNNVTLSATASPENAPCQLWRFVPAGGGWARLQLKQNNQYLDADHCGSRMGLNPGSTWADGACQLWRLVPVSDGWSRLQLKNDGQYLDADHCTDKLGLNPGSTWDGGSCQLWRTVPPA